MKQAVVVVAISSRERSNKWLLIIVLFTMVLIYRRGEKMQTGKTKTIMLLALLSVAMMACSLMRLAEEKMSDIEAEQEPPVAKVFQSTVFQLGDEYRSEEGGFSFGTIPEYSVEGYSGYVFMEALDADPDVGPFVIFIGEMQKKDMTLDALFASASYDFDDTVEITDQRDIKIGGYPARSVEVSGHSDNGNPMKGRMVVILISPRHTLTSFATAPDARWDGELEQAYDAVINSLQFFDPVVINPEIPMIEPVANETILHQWAAYAEATTSYDDPDWAAIQMTGPPDTFVCDDLPTAWASAKKDTVEELVLVYEQPVIPLGVYIHQTHAPNQVTEVLLIDIYDNEYLVYQKKPWIEPDCPYILEVVDFEVDAPVDIVVIYVDQSILGSSWNEIDAVELVGIKTSDVPQTVDSPAAEKPASASSVFPQHYGVFPEMYQELNDIDLGKSMFYVVWQSTAEDGEYDDVGSGGTRQDQTTSAEYVIGMIGPNNRPSVSLFLPVDQKSGSFDLKAYDSGAPVKGPTVAMYIGIWLYVAEEGQIEIEISPDGKVSGKVLAYLVAKDDPQKDAAVIISLNNLSLK
jgi:hypothetical protein